MNGEQWFWALMVALNIISIVVRLKLVAEDGIRKMDGFFLAGGAAIVVYGALFLGGVV